MDVEKQADYWKIGSQEDLAAARHLMEKDHCRHALFFAHLAIEKALKAHVCRCTKDLAAARCRSAGIPSGIRRVPT